MKHPPLPMAPSSPGTKVPRVPGGKHEEHCGLHSGHNVDWELLDPTQKAAQGKPRAVARAGGRRTGERMKFRFGYTAFAMPARSRHES